jgi:hypothetical protein
VGLAALEGLTLRTRRAGRGSRRLACNFSERAGRQG